MRKYYTRACNFCYGKDAINLINNNEALPLCGNKKIAFSKVEIFIRNKNKISSKIISLKSIKDQVLDLKKKIRKDIKLITSKRKNFNNPFVMGILNMTPDSFSDGGMFNSKIKGMKQIDLMIKSGAQIIDVGGESTRPGSKTVHPKKEWKRIKNIIRIFKKKFPGTMLSVDTRKSEIMKQAIKYKTDIINDVSSFDYDTSSFQAVKYTNNWKVVHHMLGSPENMQYNPK